TSSTLDMFHSLKNFTKTRFSRHAIVPDTVIHTYYRLLLRPAASLQHGRLLGAALINRPHSIQVKTRARILQGHVAEWRDNVAIAVQRHVGQQLFDSYRRLGFVVGQRALLPLVHCVHRKDALDINVHERGRFGDGGAKIRNRLLVAESDERQLLQSADQLVRQSRHAALVHPDLRVDGLYRDDDRVTEKGNLQNSRKLPSRQQSKTGR
ncbi:hypothetical protein PFISCL1PPCAC_22569, partial [Pristionchus fissidentatus]